MSDLYGAKTKKVTTYGRRGNQTNVISIHHDLSPAPIRIHQAGSTSPTTPLNRFPLSSKHAQDSINIPEPPSPEDTISKDKVASKPGLKTHASFLSNSTTSSIDSPRLVRRMYRPGRKAIPSSPSSRVSSPEPEPTKVSSSSRIDCVEIPITRPAIEFRAARQVITLDSDLEKSIVAEVKGLSLNIGDASADTASTLSTLTSVCTDSTVQPFQRILDIARTLVASKGSTLRLQISKAGEATYSEVFTLSADGTDPIVMKVIPVTGTEAEQRNGDTEVPFVSIAVDVAKEIEITKKMSVLSGGGFIPFIGAYVVRGEYHPDLLAEWDVYSDKHGTENTRPSTLSLRQHYAVIFLADGGDDLEAFRFDKKVGWIQAAGVFWQVADALARAEKLVEFEHRDLHEGQILIESHSTSSSPILNHLDPETSGVRATIIDFGLSRVRAGEDRVISTSIPDDILDGVGEQWDVYRAIEKRVASDWEGYHPITNLMWLQYILNRLFLHTPTLKRPRQQPLTQPTRSTTRVVSKTRGTTGSLAEADMTTAAYAQLQQAKDAIDTALNKRIKKCKVIMGSAADVMAWARNNGVVERSDGL